MSSRSLAAAFALPLAHALLVAALLSACGADPVKLTDEGYSALNSSRYETALARFDAALAQTPESLEARMGSLRARAYLAPEAAAQDFVELAAGQKIAADQYRALVVDLYTAGAYAQAVELLTAGKEAYPDDPKWDAQIQIVGDRVAAQGGQDGLLDALKGLGYIGNVDDLGN